MYDRATRSLNVTIGCTPEHVGPGTYDHRRQKFFEGLIIKKRRQQQLFFSFIWIEGYAPFLSLSNRGDLFGNDENPGPGQYDIRTDRSLTVKVRWKNIFEFIFLFFFLFCFKFLFTKKEKEEYENEFYSVYKNYFFF